MHPSFLEERLPRKLAIREPRLLKELHIHERRACKHNCLEQQQTDPPRSSCTLLDNLHQFGDLNQWHIGMYEFEVALEERISNWGIKERERSFREEVVNLGRGHLLREGFEVARKDVLDNWGIRNG